jgi:hypothetical protein
MQSLASAAFVFAFLSLAAYAAARVVTFIVNHDLDR